METKRLVLRKIDNDDFNALLSFMGKKEVMYAWEHAFDEDDVHDWIERQMARYAKDGIGYFAVTLKETGKHIGQAGLMTTAIDGKEVVELGYILDDRYWHNGYAVEAAGRLLEYAFGELKLSEVHCSIRPENKASIRVAEKLGMEPYGSHIVTYRGKDMPHFLYKKTKQ